MTPFRQLPFEALPERPRRPHGWFDAEARTVRVAGRDAHVRVHGAGPSLLLVHGLMTSSYSWRYALGPLGERFTCFAPDLPGAGRTPPADGYAPDALADWLAALQEALGIRGCAVVGNSMGGYLCMTLALRDPGAMSRLVNLHSPGVPTKRLYALDAALRLPGSRRLLRALVARDPERWAHRNVHYYDESLKSREETREYGAPLATGEGVDALAGYLAETMSPWAMRRFVGALRDPFPVPLQLVYAERDPMVPPRVGRALAARLPGAELVWLREASHFAHVDATDAFVAAALPFLQRGVAPT